MELLLVITLLAVPGFDFSYGYTLLSSCGGPSRKTNMDNEKKVKFRFENALTFVDVYRNCSWAFETREVGCTLKAMVYDMEIYGFANQTCENKVYINNEVSSCNTELFLMRRLITISFTYNRPAAFAVSVERICPKVKCSEEGEIITVREDELWFRYPRYGPYKDRERCFWTIQHADNSELSGKVSIIGMESKDRETCIDFVTLNGQITCRGEVTAVGRKLIVSFLSDGSVHKNGFEVYVRKTPTEDDTPFLQSGTYVLFFVEEGAEYRLFARMSTLVSAAYLVNLGPARGKRVELTHEGETHVLNRSLDKPPCSVYEVGCDWHTTEPQEEKQEDRYIIPKELWFSLMNILRKKHPSVFVEVPNPKHPVCNFGWPDGGNCSCYIGFSGDNCDKGCGPNRFGPNCEALCTKGKDMCRGVVFHTTRGTSCASGFRGLSCTEGCSSNRFGPNCLQRCGRCFNADGCDVYTGVCNSGCEFGFEPPLCQDRVVHFDGPLQINNITYSSADIRAKINERTTKGIGTPEWCNIHYRVSGTSDWESTSLTTIPDTGEVLIKLENLSPGVIYESKLVVYNDDLVHYDKDAITSFTTVCTHSDIHLTLTVDNDGPVKLSWEDEYKADMCPSSNYTVGIWWDDMWLNYNTSNKMRFYNAASGARYYFRVSRVHLSKTSPYYYSSILVPKAPVKINQIRVVSRTADCVGLSWDFGGTVPKKITVSFECDMLGAQEEENCEEDRGIVEVESLEPNIRGLSPFRRYRFIFDVPNRTRTIFYAATKPSVPWTTPRVVRRGFGETNIFAEWEKPTEYSKMNGVFSGFTYSLQDEEGEVVVENSTRDLSANITGLLSGTNYTLLVWFRNSEGINKTASLSIPFRTQPSSPGEVEELVAYKKGRKMVGLRWGKPSRTNGELSHFIIETESMSPLELQPTPCISWPLLFCHTITLPNYQPTINFTVSAVNTFSQGPGKLITVNTTELAPGAPLDLRVDNILETSVLVSWRPPKFFNGMLRSFLIKFEQTDAADPSKCCSYFPKVEVMVQEELPEYSTSVSGLSSGSSFALSVMAETVWLGPPIQGRFSTRPPRPLPPALPRILLAPHLPQPSWLSNASSDATSRNNLLLVIPLSAENETSSITPEEEVMGPDLHQVLSEEIKQKFYVATKYSEEEHLEMAGEDGDFERYQLVAASVANYSGLHSVTTIWSEIFQAPPSLKAKPH